MQCINKIKAGWNKAGELTFKSRSHDPSLVGFELECRKCLPCRLNIAREKAIRAYHESQMHEKNIFLTLTYDKDHLKSPVLQPLDFELFMKSLRISITRDIKDPELLKKLAIPLMVTGEYGEKNKRPHWHALLFNYRPDDAKPKYKTKLHHQVWTSDFLTTLWGKGNVEFGTITLDSASYTARYAAKKLVHGDDQSHEYHPVHRTSKRYALGKSWIEKYWKQTFDRGYIVLPNGQESRIPRYYVDWLKKNQPTAWEEYVTGLKIEMQKIAMQKNREEELEYFSALLRQKSGDPMPINKKKVKLTILNQKFQNLQGKLKL